MRMKKQKREKQVKENIEFEKLVDEFVREEFGDEEAEEIKKVVKNVKVEKIKDVIHEGLLEASPNVVYVNELLSKMIAENINEVKLTEEDYLMNVLDLKKNTYNEETVKELPEYRKIVNRIKVLSGLNPVHYKEEKMGKFSVRTNGQDYKIETTIGVKDSYVKLVKQIA